MMAGEMREFSHHMLKEIYEQPEAIRATLAHYLKDGTLDPEPFAAVAEALRGHERLVIAASGSSRHAGLAAEIILEDLAGLTVDVEYASEYCYRSTHTLQSPGVVVISQSGETADTLAALKEAKSRGLSTVAVTNNATSTMAKSADASLPVYVGSELAIPATKSFTGQLVVLYLLALHLAHLRGRLTRQGVAAMCAQAASLPGLLEAVLPEWEAKARTIATSAFSAGAVMFLGRGIHYAIAREGALKLKESAYVQAEGYPTGELKHGPNALVNSGAALVVLATKDEGDPDSVLRYEKSLQLVRDLKEQGAQMFLLASDGDLAVDGLASEVMRVPRVSEYLLPVLEVIPLQLLAYWSAILRGIDVDHPRNLVKAVVRE